MGKGGKPKVCHHSVSWHLGTKTKEEKGFKKGMGGKLCWMLRGWVGWRQRSCWPWQEDSKRHLKINTCKTVLELFPLKVLFAPVVENFFSISSAENPGVTPDSSFVSVPTSTYQQILLAWLQNISKIWHVSPLLSLSDQYVSHPDYYNSLLTHLPSHRLQTH